MSSLRADSMSRPKQKMFNDTSSGRDMSGLDAKRRKNLAQAAPMTPPLIAQNRGCRLVGSLCVR